MTWKSYAAVSGATVLAGWLASTPPGGGVPTAGAPSLAPASSRRANPPSDIEREAERLQARVRREVAYAQPLRNPFRFGAMRSTVRSEVEVPGIAPPENLSTPALAPPPVSLSGIAEAQSDQRIERTAILSSPAGVLLVSEGDEVLGQYRVSKIESEAVELVKLSDGATLRLSFAEFKP